jgi:hypothetical protein
LARPATEKVQGPGQSDVAGPPPSEHREPLILLEPVRVVRWWLETITCGRVPAVQRGPGQTVELPGPCALGRVPQRALPRFARYPRCKPPGRLRSRQITLAPHDLFHFNHAVHRTDTSLVVRLSSSSDIDSPPHEKPANGSALRRALFAVAWRRRVRPSL